MSESLNMTNVDKDRRRFLVASTSVVGAVGGVFAAVPFVASFMPSERAKAVGAPIEIDISKIEPGQRVIHKWRGKPVWVVRRDQKTLDDLASLDSQLKDPESNVTDQQPDYAKNTYRSSKPEFLVLVGICTHLGCSPSFIPADSENTLGADWKGGFFCPCHGSRFDLAGRVFQGVPAPTNMVVPPHQYLSDTLLLVGVDEGAA